MKTPPARSVLLLQCCLCLFLPLISSIQVHESIADDVTTITTTLLTSAPAQSNGQDQDQFESSTAAMGDSSTTTERPFSPTVLTAPIVTTKTPRVENGSPQGRDTSRLDQQSRSTVKVNKQFVPSPQLSPITFPTASAARENVLPLSNLHLHYPQFDSQLQALQPTQSAITSNALAAGANYKFYKPTTDNLIFGEPNTDAWRLSGPSQQSQQQSSYQYPITSNGGSGGKWYWMPNSLSAAGEGTLTTAGSPFAADPTTPSNQPTNWRWMFDQKYPAIGPSGPEAGGGYPSYAPRPSPASTPDFQRGEHPYSFDPPGGYGKGQRPPRPFSGTRPLSGEEGGPFSTEITVAEWNSIVKGRPDGGASGVLLKEPPKAKGASPWKKIMHVLSAAIPIGLLISAFTPQYVYVDPNSTASLSQPPPFGPKYDPSYGPKLHRNHQQQPHDRSPLHFSHIHRALSGVGGDGSGGDGNGGASETASLAAADAAVHFVPTNESLANLFDEVNALFVDGTAAADESEDGGVDNDSAANGVDDDDYGDGDATAAAAHCKFRDICEMSLLGAAAEANVVHRMLWTLANEKEERNGTTIGANELFGSIRRRNCTKYECPPPASVAHK